MTRRFLGNTLHLIGRPLVPVAALFLVTTLAQPALAGAGPSLLAPRSALLLASPAQIQQQLVQPQPPQGEMVENIVVDGNVSIPDDTVLFFLESRAGAPFDWETARRDYRTLLNSGFFDNIDMRWQRGATGVIITITLRERPRLRQIRIEGTEKVSPDDLIERMELIEQPIEEESYLDMQKMRRAKEVLETMLQGEEGFQFVQVTLDVVDSQEGAGVDALFSVVEGDQVRIENVHFEGATVFTQREIRWMMKRTGENWLGSMLTKNDRFSWAGFEADMWGLQNEYRIQGYLDFTWGQPVVEVFDVDQPLFFDEAQRLFVTIPVEEGPQYRVGEVKVEGNQRYTDEQLLALVPLQTGEVFNVEMILDAQKAMEGIYMNQGYLQVLVSPVPSPNPETGIADLTYRIWENDLYYVRRIDFEGNTNTRDYVMRRNLTLNETDQYSQGRFQQSLYKIYQLGYFDNVEPELSIVDPQTGEVQVFDLENRNPQPIERAEGEEPGRGEVDIKLKVNEVGRNQISFGGGISALEGGFVQFGYSTRLSLIHI